jgi:nitrosocyanin
MIMKVLSWAVILGMTMAGFGVLLGPHSAAGAAMKVKEVTFLNVELEGSKIWLPGILVLRRGDEVKVKLINKHKDPHGFAVDELKVQAVVDGAATKDVTLRASRTGTFRLYCHLHPAHIGGQIIVNP